MVGQAGRDDPSSKDMGAGCNCRRRRPGCTPNTHNHEVVVGNQEVVVGSEVAPPPANSATVSDFGGTEAEDDTVDDVVEEERDGRGFTSLRYAMAADECSSSCSTANIVYLVRHGHPLSS